MLLGLMALVAMGAHVVANNVAVALTAFAATFGGMLLSLRGLARLRR